MNKKSFLFKIIGLLLVLISFFLNVYNLLRIVAILFGILLLTIGLLLFQKRKGLKIVLVPILLLIFMYAIDYGCVYFLGRVPIFVYENRTDNTFATYDSLLYRVYDCNGNTILDWLYKKSYVCDFPLEVKEINAFLDSGNNNYHKYRSKFVTIKGKVSEVFGNEYISLQAYEQKENNLGGELIFNKNVTLKIKNNQGNLKLYGNYEIYDNVLVTGRIYKKENNEIIMYDAKIETLNNFSEFSINVIEEKSCKNKRKELTKVGDYQYYSECLDEVFVKYDEDTIYDVILALETKKLSFEKWVGDIVPEENEEKELYKFDTYNLLKCKNTNTILIGNKKLKLNSNFCET